MTNSQQLDRHGFEPAPAGIPWVPKSSRSETSTETALPYSTEVHPQLRTDNVLTASTKDASSLPVVYRCLQVLTTAAGQLPLTVERNGQTLRGRAVPSIIKTPNTEMSQSEFVQEIVLSLAATGNAYLHTKRVDGVVMDIEVWNPHHASIGQDRNGRRTYHYDGKSYSAADVFHLRKGKLPGTIYGAGPIQAANPSLAAALQQRKFANNWFDTTGQPAGVLTSEEALTPDQAALYRNSWNQLDAEGNPVSSHDNPSRIKVLGKGLHYEPINISPKEAQWIDVQNFSTLDIARMFGVPTSLLYAALEGNSMTYTNVEQEWLAFVRFTLMEYLMLIEDALTKLTPTGQRVKFNIEGLLRSDSKTRYQTHAVGITNGFMTPNEARDIEGLPAIDGGDQLVIPAARATETPERL